jgi:hypothetical protein
LPERRRLRRPVDDVAVDVDSSVVETAKAAFLVAPERKRSAAVRAVLVDYPEPAEAVAKRHQVFAQQSHPHRCAVALGDLFGQTRRYPVAAHQLAHRRIALDPAKQLVVFDAQHAHLRPSASSRRGCPSRRNGHNIRTLSK